MFDTFKLEIETTVLSCLIPHAATCRFCLKPLVLVDVNHDLINSFDVAWYYTLRNVDIHLPMLQVMQVSSSLWLMWKVNYELPIWLILKLKLRFTGLKFPDYCQKEFRNFSRTEVILRMSGLVCSVVERDTACIFPRVLVMNANVLMFHRVYRVTYEDRLVICLHSFHNQSW